MSRRVELARMALAVIITLGVLAMMIFYPINDTNVGEEWHEAEDWCEAHNGELVVVHSIAHGGLHCDLPNGTSVHMDRMVSD